MLPTAERYCTRLLGEAGVEVNGPRPWDIRVHDRRIFARVLLGGSLALGEAYMDGWWDCEDLETLFERLVRWRHQRPLWPVLEWPRRVNDLRRRFLGLQNRRRAHQVVHAHYDLSPALFEAMLGKTMAYSCAYWPEADTLDEAQSAKLDLVCRKLGIRESDRVLDLGCGFGSFARFAAENYGCSVVAVNLSSAQVAYAREFTRGLPVEIHRCDYRDVDTYARGRRFDKIASIAMFEAVGHRNYRRYMELVHDLLADGGLWLLHTLGDRYCSSDPWMNRHIFPNGELPTLSQLNDAILGLFQLEDVHNFGLDYCRTLQEWERNFRAAWPAIRRADESRFDDRFFRMWTYYLGSCRGSLRARNMHLWHLVMSRDYSPVVYRSVR
jgi:cyclopropane-fatty-acyl-phospholipid synthase